jgi:hypothetical protein
MPTLTIAPSPQATERTYEWAAKADVHHWFNTDRTYEWAAKADVHHWFTADQATQTAKADVHHWFNAAADQSAPAQVELSLN